MVHADTCIRWGSSIGTREGTSINSGIVEECNFHRLLLAICSKTLGLQGQHIQSLDGILVISK